MESPSSNSIVFFRWIIKSQKNLILLIFFLLILQTLFITWTVYVRSLPIYVQLYEENKVATPPMLNEEFFRTNEVITWTQELLIKTFSWNYHNWKNSFNKVRPFYSEGAFTAFLDGVKGTLGSVQSQRGTILCVINNFPKIKNKKIVNGVYQWEIEVPLSLSLEGLNGNTTIQTNVTLVVQRNFFVTSDNQTEGYKPNSSGLIVEQIIMQ